MLQRLPLCLRSQFWRWTGALGWSLDFILLCWALFLRKIGIIDQGQDWGFKSAGSEFSKKNTHTLFSFDVSERSEFHGKLGVGSPAIFFFNHADFLENAQPTQWPEDPDLESLTYDSATYADLVASQLQEERYVACQPFFPAV